MLGVRGRIAGVVFYLGLAVLLAGILLEAVAVLPGPLAVRLAHNSEGFLAALAVAGWIQFARPRLSSTGRERLVTGLAAVACLAAGLALLATHLPGRFRTLNETFLALALLLPYLQLRRPLPRPLAAGLSAGLFVVVVLFESTAAVTDLAETVGLLILAPIGFDLVDRGILDRRAPTSARARTLWYVALAALPVVFSVLQYRVGLTGVPGVAVRYAVRVTEAFVCMLLVDVYFAVLLGWTGSGQVETVRRHDAVRGA